MACDEEQLAGHVIVAAGRIERLLKNAGAVSSGIHDAVSELEGVLSAECVRKLRYVASVRNKLAHGEALSAPLDLASFDAVCGEITAELTKCAVAGGVNRAPARPANMVEELDMEFRNSVRRRLRLCGLLPGLNIIYFLALCVRAFSVVVRPLILLVFVLISLPVLIEGLRTGNRLYLFIGGFFFVLYWVLTLFYGLSRRADYPGIGRASYMVPLYSAVYLLRLLAAEVRWGEFCCGFLPLCGYASLVLLRWRLDYAVLLLCFVAIWLVGVLLVAVRRKQVF